MIKTKQDFSLKVQLIISVLIVVPVAFVYAFKPESQFDIHLNSIDEFNQFKAIMGLYLFFAALWILGILKSNYLKAAIISNMIFMLGLGFGRILSMFLDGIQTFGHLFGTAGELVLGCYGLWVLKSKSL